MRVALYSRVSTKQQEKKGTIASQIAALRTYASQQHHMIAENYVCNDDGYSGALLARPGLDILRDGAEAGAFDAVLVLSPDRLSRKYAYLILILEEFERFGIKVIFLDQPPSDDPHNALLVQIQGAVAEYERAKHAERYRRGKLYRARQGEVFWNSIPYGYRRIPRRDNIPAHLVINEAEAEVVRNIFKWHVDECMTIRQIARRLSREGYPTPKGGGIWIEATVHRTLHRKAYLGTLYYNQAATISVPPSEGKTSHTKKVLRPEAEWIPISIPVIIDHQTFERSQERHVPNSKFSPRNIHEEYWLLRRLLRCGKCGFKCACVADKKCLHKYHYRCGGHGGVSVRPRCRSNHRHSQPLDDIVWQEIRRCLLNPELLLKAKSIINDTQSLDQSFLSGQFENVKKRLSQVQAERRRLIDAFQGGFVSKEDFEDRAHTVSTRINTLQDDLKTLEQEQKAVSEGKQLLTGLKDFTSAITKKIDSITFQQKQALARMVLKEVVIHDNIVKIYFKIPVSISKNQLPKNKKNPLENTLSMKLNLRHSHSDSRDIQGEAPNRY